MNYETLLVNRDGNVAIVRINRAESMTVQLLDDGQVTIIL